MIRTEEELRQNYLFTSEEKYLNEFKKRLILSNSPKHELVLEIKQPSAINCPSQLEFNWGWLYWIVQVDIACVSGLLTQEGSSGRWLNIGAVVELNHTTLKMSCQDIWVSKGLKSSQPSSNGGPDCTLGADDLRMAHMGACGGQRGPHVPYWGHRGLADWQGVPRRGNPGAGEWRHGKDGEAPHTAPNHLRNYGRLEWRRPLVAMCLLESQRGVDLHMRTTFKTWLSYFVLNWTEFEHTVSSVVGHLCNQILWGSKTTKSSQSEPANIDLNGENAKIALNGRCLRAHCRGLLVNESVWVLLVSSTCE